MAGIKRRVFFKVTNYRNLVVNILICITNTFSIYSTVSIHHHIALLGWH